MATATMTAKKGGQTMDELAQVRRLSAQWDRKKDAAREIRAKLIAEVVSAHDAGASEYQLSKTAGVGRDTIRKWLGK